MYNIPGIKTPLSVTSTSALSTSIVVSQTCLGQCFSPAEGLHLPRTVQYRAMS